MGFFVLVMIGVVTVLCYGLLNNCLNLMSKVKKENKNDVRK
jgi:hypothetical protein